MSAAAPGKPRVAFVAGGGAVKAYAYHLGVLRGLEEDGFHFRSGVRWAPHCAPPSAREIEIFVGSSAGGCAVTAIASGRSVETQRHAIMASRKEVPVFGYRVLFVPVAPNPLRYARRLARRWRLGGLHAADLLETGGLFSTAGVERYFRDHALPTNRFGDLAADLFLVATQVNNSRRIAFGPLDSASADGYDGDCAYYDNIQISHALAACIAVPPLFAPYAITNPSSGKTFHYYDGEVREPVSLDIARDAGADFAIVSSIWSPYVYDDRVGTVADLGVSAVGFQALHQIVEQKVARARRQAEQVARVVELLAAHDAAHGVPPDATAALQQRVQQQLGVRPVDALYVTPDPEDHAFFFRTSYFRFERKLIARCMDVGLRAYRRALAQQPGFLAALDRRLAALRTSS